MVQQLKNKIDNKLFKEFLKLPNLAYHQALKQDRASLIKQKKSFFKTGELPQFVFSKANKISVDKYLSALNTFENRIDGLTDRPIAAKLYKQKVDELKNRAHLVQAIQNKDDEQVTALSIKLYGQPKQSASDLKKEFGEMLEHASIFKITKKPIDAETFARMVRETLDYYGLTEWRIKLSSKSSIHIKHGFATHAPVLRIPKRLKVTKARAARLLTHEIEVHALRTFNGMQSDLALLGRGLDNYLLTEEGLATHFQGLISKKEHQHLPGFWDAWTAVLCLQGDFTKTFEIIHEAKTRLAEKIGYDDPQEKGSDAAWRLCLRSYRGISDLTKPNVGFVRDHVYRSGNIVIKQTLKKQSDDILPLLFAGNLGLQHLEDLRALNIAPGRVPDFIGKKIVKKLS